MKNIVMGLCLGMFTSVVFADSDVVIFNDSQKYAMTVSYVICEKVSRDGFRYSGCDDKTRQTITIPPMSSSTSNTFHISVPDLVYSTFYDNEKYVLVDKVTEADNQLAPALFGICAVHPDILRQLSPREFFIALSDHGGNSAYITCSTTKKLEA